MNFQPSTETRFNLLKYDIVIHDEDDLIYQVEEALLEMKDTGAVLLFHAECEVEEPDLSSADPGRCLI